MLLYSLYFNWLLILSTAILTETQLCGTQKVTNYHETDDQLLKNVFNPARGFYLESMTSARFFHPLTKDHLACLRDNHGTNLMLRLYSLDNFADGSPITEEFKQKLAQDFQAARDAGWSLVVRFMYQNTLDTQYNPQSEPSIQQIQNHIKQLTPILAQYDGVVVAVQAGFHGEYGLWFTPGTNTVQQNTAIINTLLKDLPNDIPVQVVHPDFKRNQSNPEQIGHYHECLLEGDTNNIKSAFPDLSVDTSTLAYLKTDTESSVIGGKTCHPGDTVNPPRNLCSESLQLFKDLHLTYLNQGDPDEAIQNYKRYGCYDNIADSLGYRLALESVSLPNSVNFNSSVCVGITLSNRGYSAPFRHYNVSFVIQDHFVKSIVYKAPLSTDTTKWLPGKDITLTSKFNLPPNTQPGTLYDVYLQIADPVLSDNSDYYILLSNSNPQLTPMKGMSKVGSIQVSKTFQVGSPDYKPTSTLKSWSLPAESTKPRIWQQVTRSCLQIPNGPPLGTGSTTAAPIQGMTNAPPDLSTTPAPFVPFINDTSKLDKCKKLETVKALLQFSYFSHSGTQDCPNSSSKATPEAILISYCNAPTNTIFWRPKGRVIDNCEKIPMYSRVAVFSNFNYYDYDTTIRKCGVFLGCLKTGSKVTGVKIGMQLCGRPFDIENAQFSNEKDLNNLYVF